MQNICNGTIVKNCLSYTRYNSRRMEILLEENSYFRKLKLHGIVGKTCALVITTCHFRLLHQLNFKFLIYKIHVQTLHQILSKFVSNLAMVEQVRKMSFSLKIWSKKKSERSCRICLFFNNDQSTWIICDELHDM